MRHSPVVRITHWISTGSVIALVVSGAAILLAHPRLYWGETGTVGVPSLVDLPLPFVLTGQTGWGRSLHFLAAWICVLTGALYILVGSLTGHFRANLLPSRGDRSPAAIARSVRAHLRFAVGREPGRAGYNALQRLTYSLVVFGLSPLMIWTGLAMSPAVTSVWPWLVTSLGGHQSARTLHFVGASLVLLFLAVHVTMIAATGFVARMRAMTIGVRGQS